MDKNTTGTVQKLKSERVQEEVMTVGAPGDLKDPLVISLKAERVQEPAAASGEAGAKTASWLELSVNPYQRVTIELPALMVNVTLEQPMTGASWSAGLVEAG